MSFTLRWGDGVSCGLTKASINLARGLTARSMNYTYPSWPWWGTDVMLAKLLHKVSSSAFITPSVPHYDFDDGFTRNPGVIPGGWGRALPGFRSANVVVLDLLPCFHFFSILRIALHVVSRSKTRIVAVRKQGGNTSSVQHSNRPEYYCNGVRVA